jgi:hypothetical protein
MANGAAQMAAGFQLSAGIDGIKSFVGSIYDAAKAEGAEVKQLANVLAMNDRAGKSFKELRADASQLHEQLEEIGIAAGQDSGALTDAFEDISSRSNKSTGEVTRLVEQMASAGRVVKGGMGALSEAFGMIEAGAIRPRNPIVQLIAQTGVLSGNAKKVAKDLQAMKPEDAIKVGEEAIRRMADKTKDLKMGFGENLQSIKNIRDNLLEAAGGPLLDSLKKPMTDLRNYFAGHREEMQHYAEVLGTKVGEWVTAAADKVREGFAYLESHGDEIKAALTEAWDHAKKVVEFIIAHKKEIAVGLAAHAAVGAAPAALGAGKQALDFLKYLGTAEVAAPQVFKLGEGMAEVGRSSASLIAQNLHGKLGEIATGAKAAAIGLGAATAAFAAVYLAVEQWIKMMDEINDQADTKQKGMKTLMDLANQGQSDQLDNAISTARMLGTYDEAFLKNVEQLAANTDSLNETVSAKVANMLNSTAEGLADGSVGVTDEVGTIVDAYNFAAGMHNAAAQQMAAQFLLDTGFTKETLVSGGYELQGGFEQFQSIFGDAVGKTADQLKHFMGGDGAGAFKPPAANVHIGGGNTFNIKQDFRDQDPDRIALVFRRDIVRAAEARHQSRLGAAFGGI